MSQPKSLLKEPMNELETIISSELIKMCGIPGCLPVLHKEDAKMILFKLEDAGYKIKKERK